MILKITYLNAEFSIHRLKYLLLSRLIYRGQLLAYGICKREVKESVKSVVLIRLIINLTYLHFLQGPTDSVPVPSYLPFAM